MANLPSKLSGSSNPHALASILQSIGFQKKGKKVQERSGSDAHKIEELSAEDQRQIAREMIELATSKTKKEIKHIRKRKELQEMKGKEKNISKVTFR